MKWNKSHISLRTSIPQTHSQRGRLNSRGRRLESCKMKDRRGEKEEVIVRERKRERGGGVERIN